MIIRRQTMAALIMVASVVLTGCGTGPPPSSDTTPDAVSSPTATAAVVELAVAEPTAVVVERVVTATPAPATSTPAYSPAAKLVRNTPAGKCRWVIYMSLTGFAPNSWITVTSDFDEVDCATGKVLKGASWTDVYGVKTDANGRLLIDYLHESTGDYHYTFTDELGNRASLPFSTEPEPTQTPRVSATPAATARSATRTPAPATATTQPDPQVVVKSATLNLRSGPGQAYPVVGQVVRGNKLYPTARFGNCEWLQVGVLGQDDLVWVAGGPQFVTLNVPCAALRIQDSIPPTPLPAPTAVPRPATGLIARSASFGSGELLIKNGTDSDGVVILVDMSDTPVQAAYIRAADSFRMTQIADGTYRLYFSKGEAWDAGRKEFTRNVSRQRFAETLPFGGQYAGYEVTLYGVAGGNAATQNVPPGQFPAVP